MLSTPKWIGLLAVAFATGSLIASPELRAFAANTIGSADIINESILSADIKNGEVKASDIATDAVGAAEIQGVTKLIFAKCSLTSSEGTVSIQPGQGTNINCAVSGVASGDQAIASLNHSSTCFATTFVETEGGDVNVVLFNICDSPHIVGAGSYISLVIYHK
jgi:hypothetical protein